MTYPIQLQVKKALLAFRQQGLSDLLPGTNRLTQHNFQLPPSWFIYRFQHR